MKTKFLILLIFTALMSCEESKDEPSKIEGKIEGSNTEYLVLQYTDSIDNFASDTLHLNRETFSIENPIKSPQKVSLTSNLTGRSSMEDPNRLIFFLEPGNISLYLKEDHFAQAEITGSKTHLESENLKEATKPFFDEMENLYHQRQNLITTKKNSNGSNPEGQIDSLNSLWQNAKKNLEEVQISYAFENPDSYVSAEIINSYRKKLPQDSLKLVYKNFPPEIQQSLYGKNIKEEIDLYVVDSGDKAPVFTGKNLQGEEIRLDQLKGNVVVLDFTAGWCIPCIKNHPQLKKIYDEYHPLGLEIISISFDKNEEEWKSNVLKEDLNWHHIYQGYHRIGTEGAISTLYTIKPIPAYILIDQNGTIVNRYAGADMSNKNLDDLENDLKRTFSESNTFANSL